MALKAAGKPATNASVETPEVPDEIPRGRSGRPNIRALRADGTDDPAKLVSYTRASTLGKALEDQTGLDIWRKRMVTWGLGRDKALVLAAASVATTTEDADKGELDRIAEEALTIARASSGATRGTALHKLSEQRDAGTNLSHLPTDAMAALDAYSRLMAGFEVIASETFVVCDALETAGSFDRLVSPRWPMEAPDGSTIEPGDRLILDLKGLALDTPIPTPTGWSTMGALRVGDTVFGSDGQPCSVTAKSTTKRIGTYVVTFDDGAQVTCDREHLWWVMTGRGARAGLCEQVIGVEDMRDTLFRYGQRQHRVPVALPLDLPDVELPIDPYLYGMWLGDGSRDGGVITKDPAMFEMLRADGHETGGDYRRDGGPVETRTVFGLRTALRKAGLLGHKVIPGEYLRASIEQRIALLRGLMDSDGTWNLPRRRAQFCGTDKALVMQVHELALTLGLRAHFATWTARGYGVETTAYGVDFAPEGFNPFRLARKAERVVFGKGARSRYRVVQSVEPGPDVETACIAVDSSNHTYLCGREMVPTHNTNKDAKYFGPTYACQQAVYAYGRPYSHRDGRYEWPLWHRDGREGPPSRNWALILHVPIESVADAGLHWVDLQEGYELAELARTVRAQRGRKDLFYPAEPPREARPAAIDAAGLVALIRNAVDYDMLTALYEQHTDVWTDECGAAADERAGRLDQLLADAS